METQALFTLAKRFDVKALSILTISDSILTGDASTALERQESFNDMMKIALSLA
jgi:purine-nucleoside phosphorylase